MLPRRKRISTPVFLKLSQNTPSFKAKTLHSPLLTVRIMKEMTSPNESNKSSGEPWESRFAVIVSKKTAKTAPRRNYLRRKTYESLRPLVSHVAPLFYAFVYPKMGCEKASLKDMTSDLKELFQNAGIYS